jgi:Ala-tRNA(Pro) deacylase
MEPIKESTDVFDKLVTFLQSKGTKYTLTEHVPVTTSEEAAKIRGVTLESGAKAMIIKGFNKAKLPFYSMLVFSAAKKILWPPIKKALNSKNIEIAPVEEVTKMTVFIYAGLFKWCDTTIWLSIWASHLHGPFS